MQNISHIIFDWDGTVMDSAAKIVHCMQVAASSSKLPVPSAHEVHQIIGISLVPAIAQLFSISINDAKEVSEHYKRAFIESDAIACDLFTDAFNTLASLAQTHTLGVATGKARRGLLRAFDASNTGHFFKSTRCADDPGISSKPHPSMLQQLLNEWGIQPHQALMVGDTTYDMRMAESIGMPRIGVSYGVHDVKHIAMHNPIAIIDEISALQTLLQK